MDENAALPETQAPVEKPKRPVVRADVLPKTVVEHNLLEVRDDQGHLLFCFNATSRSIEIKARGKMFAIRVDVLASTAARNWISDEPVTVMTAEEVDAPVSSGIDNE